MKPGLVYGFENPSDMCAMRAGGAHGRGGAERKRGEERTRRREEKVNRRGAERIEGERTLTC